MDLEDQLQQALATIRSQDAALAHWRREADRDAGKIARYEKALCRIRGLKKETLESWTAANVAIEVAREALGEANG